MKCRIEESFSLNDSIKSIGADPVSFDIFFNKKEIVPIRVKNIKSPAANILKQELIGLGGDAVVHKKVITCAIDRSDVLLLGTLRMYSKLSEKLKYMNYWELGNVKREIEEIIRNFNAELPVWKIRNNILDFNKRVYIMGIINTTPDSFYSGSRYTKIDSVLKRAKEMIEDGADIIDIGGESTSPFSKRVSVEEEMDRVIPIIERIRKEFSIPISIDTYKSKVAEEAVRAGADIINDISASKFDDRMLDVVKENDTYYIAMHIKGTPENMQVDPHYDDVLMEEIEYFDEILSKIEKKGINRKKICIDPGIGFGKNDYHNRSIITGIGALKRFGLPILIGASRKSMIGRITKNKEPKDRLSGTIAISTISTLLGANILRVHDVKENKDAVHLTEYLMNKVK
jgi:dihydropteroate synthase